MARAAACNRNLITCHLEHFSDYTTIPSHRHQPPACFNFQDYFEKIKKSIKRIRKSFQPRMSKSSARDRNQFVGRPAPRPPRRGVRSQVSTRTTSDHWLEWRRNAYTRCIQATTWAAILLQGNNEEFLNFKHSTLSQRFYCINHAVSTRSKNIAPSRCKIRTLASTRQCPGLPQAIFSHWSLAPEPKQPPK